MCSFKRRRGSRRRHWWGWPPAWSGWRKRFGARVRCDCCCCSASAPPQCVVLGLVATCPTPRCLSLLAAHPCPGCAAACHAEELVAAMQGVSAKQFALLLKVMEQQQAQQAQQGAARATPQPQQAQQHAAAPGSAASPQRAAASSSAAGAKRAAPGAQQHSGSAAAAAGQTDEWGRAVRPLPSASGPPLPPQVSLSVWLAVQRCSSALPCGRAACPAPQPCASLTHGAPRIAARPPAPPGRPRLPCPAPRPRAP